MDAARWHPARQARHSTHSISKQVQGWALINMKNSRPLPLGLGFKCRTTYTVATKRCAYTRISKGTVRGCASKAKGPNGNRHGKPQPTVTSLLRPGLCERDAHPPAAGMLSALPRVSTKRSCVTQNIVHPRPPMVHICAWYTHTHTTHSIVSQARRAAPKHER